MEKSSLFWYFSFDFIINCLLSFFTAVILVELVLFSFRIKSIRGRIFARLIPIAKLLVDPFLYNYSNWSVLQGLHPMLANEGAREITAFCSTTPLKTLCGHLGTRCFLWENGTSFSLGDCLAYFLPYKLVVVFVMSIAMVSLGLLFIRMRKFLRARKELNRLKLGSQFYQSLPGNKEVVLSECVRSPCAILPSTIVFPKKFLSLLSEEEKDAVIAHEAEHLRFKDTYLRLFVYFMDAIFWWIPLRIYGNFLEKLQENAADQRALILHEKWVLANAVKKCAEGEPALFISGFCNRWSVSKRVKKIAKMKLPKKRKVFATVKCVIVAICMGTILFGAFWII